MSKYDCSQVADFLRERIRLCDSIQGCGECPLYGACEEEEIIKHPEKSIQLLQQWSDVNPETDPEPERDLVEVVRCKDCLRLSKYVDESGVEKQFCSTWMRFCYPDEYCSSGKRRYTVTSPAEIKED